MGVVEADNLELEIACVTLDGDQFRGIDGVARRRRGMSIPAWNDLKNLASVVISCTQQDSATLERV